MLKNQEKFVPGEEWLYYKIYCGFQASDKILISTIKPLVDELFYRNQIETWFFIRYNDPENHIRFRVKLLNIVDFQDVIFFINNMLKKHLTCGFIWDINISTYKRELARYGNSSIELAESFFYYDSEEVIKIIKLSIGDENKRLLLIYNWIEKILFYFKLKDKEKLYFLDKIQLTFKNELKVDSSKKRLLSEKYRLVEKELPYLTDAENNSISQVVDEILLLNKLNQLEVEIGDLISSFIHMSLNRCFQSNQRTFEMMLYDFMYKKNRSTFVRYGKL